MTGSLHKNYRELPIVEVPLCTLASVALKVTQIYMLCAPALHLVSSQGTSKNYLKKAVTETVKVMPPKATAADFSYKPHQGKHIQALMSFLSSMTPLL